MFRPVAGVAATLVLASAVFAQADRSAAQAVEPFRIEVSKTTDLVSGEAIQVDVFTEAGTTFSAAAGQDSRVRVCPYQESYTSEELGGDGGGTLCPPDGWSIQIADESVDSRFLYPFPGFTRAITALRPGIGTGHWTTQPGPTERQLTCDEEHRCRLVFRLNLVTNGVASSTIKPGPELIYRPTTGVAGCDGTSPDVVASTMPDRLLEIWQGWTRDVCQTDDVPPPTTAFFRPEGEGLAKFAAGEDDLAYSAVGYREGFTPATPRTMVPVPIGVNAVVLAVGGGYPVQDDSWPNGSAFPKRHTEFRLTNEHIAQLMGQAQYRYLDHYAEVNANNPWMTPGYFYLNNSTASSPLTYGGPQAATYFLSSYLDTKVPDQWVNVQGLPRGVETNFDSSTPKHAELAIKSGRPELSKVVYQQLFNEGTYYVMTDLATANALGLTIVSIPDPATPGGWITPTPESMAAAVGQMLPQDDGTLVPNPAAASGYPLTFVEYAMAPAQPLVGAGCIPRIGSQGLLDDWLTYLTTDGQAQLAAPGGLAPLTDDLKTTAAAQLNKVGATPNTCTPTTTTTPPPSSSTTTSTTPGGTGGPGTNRRTPRPAGVADPAAPVAVQEPTPETRQEALQAAEEDETELPDLLGIRAINTLLPPLALIVIVVLTALVALGTAGYPMPGALVALARWSRRALSRLWALRPWERQPSGAQA